MALPQTVHATFSVTFDHEPAIEDLTSKEPPKPAIEDLTSKEPPKLDPEPKATHSVPAGSEFALFLGRLISFTSNEVKITVETSNADFLDYEVQTNMLEIPPGITDSDDIGNYPIKIELLDSVDDLETQYSFTLKIVEPEPEPSELDCSDTEVVCVTEIDENGEETETCQCSEEIEEESCADEEKVCTVEINDQGDYIDVCVCPDPTEEASSECEEVELICELEGPEGEEIEVCRCPPAQECSPEELICTLDEAGEESCVCNTAADETSVQTTGSSATEDN